MIYLSLEHSFANMLEGFYSHSQPEPVQTPALVYFNQDLATQLDIGFNQKNTDALDIAYLFSGSELPESAYPIAQKYAGHQFGHFNPQLGDGRALIWGELKTSQGERFDLCFKGSGRTPYSRGGDGKATLAAMLREVIVSEAMSALGIPTTRSLAVVSTGEAIPRNEFQAGAILTRTAASHIRVGTFEFFASRKEVDKVKKLADYCIWRHFPEIDTNNEEEKYLTFLSLVIKKQATLISQWMGAGFIHGVMNTDNMLICGETIDYGPCAFMESFNPNAVFSSIDHNGRYAYQNQASIALWNLTSFAKTLIPLFNQKQEVVIEKIKNELSKFNGQYENNFITVFEKKIGLHESDKNNEESKKNNLEIISDWLTLLESNKVDFTFGFRALCDETIKSSNEKIKSFLNKEETQKWLQRREEHINNNQTKETAIKLMQENNPFIIPRNHRIEEALLHAEDHNDLSLFENLMHALKNPYQTEIKNYHLAEPANPAFTEAYKTFCGT